jgi:hypothetical protein
LDSRIVERTSDKNIILIPIDQRDRRTLSFYTTKSVLKGSSICTDFWKGYKGLDDLDYKHATVNHSNFFKDPVTKVHTNTIEGTWFAVKKTILIKTELRSL